MRACGEDVVAHEKCQSLVGSGGERSRSSAGPEILARPPRLCIFGGGLFTTRTSRGINRKLVRSPSTSLQDLMDHPFQAIAHYRPESFVWGADSYFIAACGPYLFSVATKAGSFGGSGEIRTKWSAAAESAEVLYSHISPRRLLPCTDDGKADAKEPELKKRRTDGNSSEGPVIIKLVLDEIYGYLVAVTDDKCLRVFQIGEQGELTQLSQR